MNGAVAVVPHVRFHGGVDLHLRPFPGAGTPPLDALQRTSDERWVSLAGVRRVGGDRWVADLPEDPRRRAVLRHDPPSRYGDALRALLDRPPPDAGPGVAFEWPVDLLHDVAVEVTGYLVEPVDLDVAVVLADLADPAVRSTVAPACTWQHLLRASRRLVAAVAAIHHAGHAGVQDLDVVVDDHARLVVRRVDVLEPAASPARLTRDVDAVGRLVVGLLENGVGPEDGSDVAALVGAAQAGRAPELATWFHALRDAERSLVSCALDPLHRFGGHLDRCPWCAPPLVAMPASSSFVDVRLSSLLRMPEAPLDWTPDEQPQAPSSPPVSAPDVPARPIAACTAATPTLRAVPSPPATPRTSLARPVPAASSSAVARSAATGTAARVAFTLGFGAIAGALTSVAPFVVVLAATATIVVRAAVLAGRRHRRGGDASAVAAVAGRLVPYATGGVAVGVFLVSDLVLVFGLVLAAAERIFDYGPGFRLSLLFDAARTPGLFRGFCFVVGALAGLAIGGDVHDRMRGSARAPRWLAVPMVAAGAGAAVLSVDAALWWWPFVLAPWAAV